VRLQRIRHLFRFRIDRGAFQVGRLRVHMAGADDLARSEYGVLEQSITIHFLIG
jgi:hypothetical protein